MESDRGQEWSLWKSRTPGDPPIVSTISFGQNTPVRSEVEELKSERIIRVDLKGWRKSTRRRGHRPSQS